jgi:hypothetical protein
MHDGAAHGGPCEGGGRFGASVSIKLVGTLLWRLRRLSEVLAS